MYFRFFWIRILLRFLLLVTLAWFFRWMLKTVTISNALLASYSFSLPGNLFWNSRWHWDDKYGNPIDCKHNNRSIKYSRLWVVVLRRWSGGLFFKNEIYPTFRRNCRLHTLSPCPITSFWKFSIIKKFQKIQKLEHRILRPKTRKTYNICAFLFLSI